MAAKNKDNLINDKKLQKKYKQYKEVTKAKTIKAIKNTVNIPTEGDLLATTKAKRFKYSPNVTLVKVLEELDAINKILEGQNKDLLTAAELITNVEVDIKEVRRDLDSVAGAGLDAEVLLSNRIKELESDNKVLAGFLGLAIVVSVASLIITLF